MRQLPDSGRQIWRPLLIGALVLLLAPPAEADLVGRSAPSATVADATDTALIEANPFLELLAGEDPELLYDVLARLRDPLPGAKRRVEVQGASEPLTESQEQILEENPDFARLFRNSPEAFLDLLRLIREAAKKQ